MSQGNLKHVVVAQGGSRKLVQRSGFVREVDLQRLVLNSPELLAPIGNDLHFLPIGREVSLPIGSLDLLFIDSEGRLTLVETKLQANDESRRSVVGQVLEYGAYMAEWDAERVTTTANEFLVSAHAPEDVANRSFEEAAAIRFGWLDDTEEERQAKVDAFQSRIDASLRRGALRIVCGVDSHIERLQRLVEYLSRHSDLQIVLLQVNQFPVNDDLSVLVPTLHGDVDGTPERTRPASEQRFTFQTLIDSFSENSEREVARKVLEAARAAGATFGMGTSGTSIRVETPLWPQGVSIAWIYPRSQGWMRTRDITLGHSLQGQEMDSRLHSILERYLRDIEAAGVLNDASSRGVNARWIHPSEAVNQVEEIMSVLAKTIRELKSPPDADAS